MRCLARLVDALNVNLSKSLSLNEYLQPEYFESIIECVRGLLVNETEDGMKAASFGIRVGHAIKNCIRLKQCIAIIEQNDGQRKLADDFMMLMTNTWNSKINSRAFRFINNRKHMEDLPLPVAQDLLKLRLYLDKKLARDFEALETNPNKDNWKALAESTLVRIVLFNKR